MNIKESAKSVLRPVLRPPLWFFLQYTSGPLKIRSYLKRNEGPLQIIFGGHSKKTEEGWFILDEKDQNILKRLKFKDNSVDVVFTEHVIEHLPVAGTISFFTEAKRILKKGGTMRTVCPMFERIYEFDPNNPIAKNYVAEGILPNFTDEERALQRIGLSLQQFPKQLAFNNIYLRHGHRHIWSAEMMKEVLVALGYETVTIRKPKEGKYAIERGVRGVTLNPGAAYDVESLVVEAIK